jgi:hypothetical protein
MVTEVVYNEWISSLFKVAHARSENELKKIFDELVEKAGYGSRSRRSRQSRQSRQSGSKNPRELTGGLKVKPSKYRHKNVTLRRQLVSSRPVYRRTTQQRVVRGTIHYLLILSSFIFIIYNAFNNPRMPNEGVRDPLLEFALLNLFIPLVGVNVVVPPISEILLFLINFQTPVAIMRALTNVSTRFFGNSELRAAQEMVGDLSHLSDVADLVDRRLRPSASRGGPSAESVAAARKTPVNRMMRLLLPEEALAAQSAMQIPRYEEFVDSTRDYLLKRSIALSDGNKRRVMLLAMSAMTSRVVVLLTTPASRGASSRRAGLVVQNMFSRVKGETAYKLIAHKTTAPGHYYTVCDSCGRTDENDEDEDTVTFSRACGNCSYDMCDTCYSKLQRRNPYSVSDDNYKVCPRCKHDI